MLMKFFLITCIMMICSISFAQHKQIRGKVIDSSKGINLRDASIVLLSKKDSFILTDTRADNDGRFKIINIYDSEECFLFISYPLYVSYSVNIDFTNTVDSIINLQNINLIPQGKLLAEIIVNAKLGNIRIRGDTIEYSAENIRMPPNSTVEDLLKKLPGLHIDNMGNITAQGKRVKMVLIDGEEFFSIDPILVTKNLRSDMIAKVQIYEKKSDVAIFTGIEDGIKDQVINIKLKEDKNNGVFGKAEVGTGTGAEKSQYVTQLILNRFKVKRKAAIYFSSNDIGRVVLASTDKNKLGIGGNSEQYDGKGLPIATSLGFHYDTKWNKDKSIVNADIFYSATANSGQDTIFSINNLPTGTIRRSSTNAFSRSRHTQNANVTYKQNLDSSSTITIYTANIYGKNKSDQIYRAIDRNKVLNLLNQSDSRTDMVQEFRSYLLNFLWQKKFKTSGRTISISLNNSFENSEGEQKFQSFTDYFNGKPIKDSSLSLNFLKKSNNQASEFLLNVNFTERISKPVSMILSYNAGRNYKDDNNLSYPYQTNPLNQYDIEFSTVQTNTKWVQTGGITVNFDFNKTSLKLSNTAGVSIFELSEKLKIQQINRQFMVWKPTISMLYKVNNTSSINLNYRGNTSSPDFEQILPYQFNNSLLVKYYKNTDLRNSYSHKFSAEYESFKSLTRTFKGVIASYKNISNPINTNLEINESGAYYIQFVNMNDQKNSEFDIKGFYSTPLKKLKTQITIDVKANGGTNFHILNGVINKLKFGIYSLDVFGYKSETEKYEVQLGTNFSYNSNNLYQNDQTTTNNFFSISLKTSTDIFLLKRLQLHNEANYLWQEKNNIFDVAFDRLIWNLWIGGSILKSKQLTIKLICNDILNANTGFIRNTTSSFFTESRFVTIRRYFMISAAWNFTKLKQLKK